MTAEAAGRIFAYGSLMWRPDFEFLNVRPARLRGYHRRLSVFSNRYRGTDEKLGVVLGLDRGGSVIGVVYDIAPENWLETLAKVREREMFGGVYFEVVKSCTVLASGETVKAVTYVVNRSHERFAPKMETEDLLVYINQGHGIFGPSRDYVANTLLHLRELGIHDAHLEKLAPHVLGGGGKT